MPTMPKKFNMCKSCGTKRRVSQFNYKNNICDNCHKEKERLRHQRRREMLRIQNKKADELAEVVDMNKIRQPAVPHQEFCTGCNIYEERSSQWVYKLCAFWGQCEKYGKIKEIINEECTPVI